MAIVLASIPHSIDDGERSLRDVMSRCNAVEFQRIAPIFDGHASFYHVAIQPQLITRFVSDAGQHGISVLTERHRD